MQLRNVEANLERSVVDACGNPLPPCIVMERGEAMDLWVARARPDRAQALSVGSTYFAVCLRELRAAACPVLGYFSTCMSNYKCSRVHEVLHFQYMKTIVNRFAVLYATCKCCLC
jgi:hypothetical protein